MECLLSRLTLRQIGAENLALIEAEHYGLKWNRDGEVRTIPRHVIENVLREYGDYLLRWPGIPDELVATIHGFRWEQAV